MPVRVTCPSCGTELAVRDEHAGRAVRCPSCKAVIPPAGAAPAPPPLPPLLPPPVDPPGPPLSVVGPPPLPGTVAPPRPAAPGRPGRPAVIIAPSVARSTAPRPAPMPPPLPTQTPPLPPDPPEEIEITDEAPPPLPAQEPAGEFDFTSAPAKPPRDEDDRPRRRPRRDEEADEDRPRRPRDDREGEREGDRPRRRPRDDDRDEDRPRRPREETGDRPRKPRDEGEAGEDRPRRPRPDDRDDRPRRPRDPRDDGDDDRPRGRGPRGGRDDGGPAKKSKLPLILALVGGFLLLSCTGAAYGVYSLIKGAKAKLEQAANDFDGSVWDSGERNDRVTREAEAKIRVGTTTRAEVEALLGPGRVAKQKDLAVVLPGIRLEDAGRMREGRLLVWRNGPAAIVVGLYPDAAPTARVAAKAYTKVPAPPNERYEGMEDPPFVLQYGHRPDPLLPANTPRPADPPVVVSAEELAEAYADNPFKGDTRFRGKRVTVTGADTSFEPPKGAAYNLTLGCGKPLGPFAPSYVRCTVTAAQQDNARAVRPNPIRVTGTCLGMKGGKVEVADVSEVAAVGAPPAPQTGPAGAAGGGDRVSAEDLYKAYQADKAAADEKYKGKVVAVTGTITGFNFRPSDPADPNRSPPELVIRLQTGDGSGVACRLPPGVRTPRPPARGQPMTLRGTCDGFDGAAVNLSGCTVEPGAEAPPPGGGGPAVRSPSASALILAYSANPETADGRYKGQTVNVMAGVVESVGEDGSVVLVSGVKPPPGAATQYKVKIKATFEKAPAAKPKVGDRVAVRGECAGLADGFVKIEKAELTANKGP